MSNQLKFISRHEPTNGQIALAQKLGYEGIEKIDIFFSNDPVADLVNAGIKPATIAGVFPLNTALALLRAGFELVVFTNSRDARDASKFVCTGADILTLQESRHIPLSEEEIEQANDTALESRLFVGSRATEGGAK